MLQTSHMSARAEKQAKRRVPETLRRRSIISCDRCKGRRVRCVRAHVDDSCAGCIQGGYKCESKLPRKQRVYGSVETLSIRYRALSALVKGMFPNEDTEDVNVLYRLANDQQIEMPPIDDPSAALAAFRQSPQDSSVSPNAPSEGAYNHIPKKPVDASSTKAHEQKLIPAPHGVSHYIGPASSFEFANAIRKLVSKCSGSSNDSIARDTKKRQLRAEFSGMKISIALEPRVRGHPATTAGEDGEDSEWDSPEVALPYDSRSIYSTPESSGRTPRSIRTRPLREILPKRDLSDILVRAFFDHVHPNYVLFHQATFQHRYEAVWSQNDPNPGSADIGWDCCVLMVLVFGAQAMERNDLSEAIAIQRRYLRKVRNRFQHLAFTASLSNVQAILLLQLYEHNAGERNTAWMLLGQASRMAIALGMHLEETGNHFDAVERNIRRMVWWTLYIFEQNLSLVLGRPSSFYLDPADMLPRLPDNTLIDGGDYPSEYTTHTLALTLISSKVKKFVTSISTLGLGESDLMPTVGRASELLLELRTWLAQLPQHLTTDWHFMNPRHSRAVLLMHVYYHHSRTIVTRQYLLATVNHQIDFVLLQNQGQSTSMATEIEAFSNECRLAAKSAIDNLHQLSTLGLLDGIGWMDFFYIYHGVLVMSLYFLGRSRDTAGDTATDMEHKACITSMIQVFQTSKLAPTYQILCKVAIQLARIVGIDSTEAPSRDEQVNSQNAETGVDEYPASFAPHQFLFGDGIMSHAFPQYSYGGDMDAMDFSQADQYELTWDFFNVNETSPSAHLI